jgi:hypothetical protein
MKTRSLLAALAFLALTPHAFAQAGYINEILYPGDNLIANQLDNSFGHTNGSGNTLDSLFNNLASSGSLASGATFTRWDPVAKAFLPASTYNASSDLWSINYTFTFGQGGILNTSVRATNTFVGSVYPGFIFGTYDWHPNYPNGLYLISDPVPLSLPIDQQFAYAIGRSPHDGESVDLFDPATQTYTLTTFHTSFGWDNGDPILGVGQSAWFNLGPVPEPSTAAFAGLSLAVLLLSRRGNLDRPLAPFPPGSISAE